MSFVIVKVVQSAVTKLVTMFNPAGAVIQAIIAIYNTIMFFVERMRQIIQVVTAFIDSIAAIASGAVQAAADRVERTLGGLLTLAISFLARLVGLGKVSDAVTNIINKIRAPIDRALDKVVEWIVEKAKKLGKSLAGAAAKVGDWWKRTKKLTAEDGQTHNLYFSGSGKQAALYVASTPAQLKAFLAEVGKNPDNRSAEKQTAIQAINVQIKKIEELQELPDSEAQKTDSGIAAAMDLIVPELAGLFGGDSFATEAKPLALDYPKRESADYTPLYLGRTESEFP